MTPTTASLAAEHLAPVPLRAVLIDVDGTLIDSNEAHARAWADILRRHGWADITWQQIFPLIGMGGDKLLPEITGIDIESPRGKALAEERTAHFSAAYAPTLCAFPRVREFFETLRDRGLKRVIATSAGEDELVELLEAAGIADLVSRETTSDDAEASKPDPDIIHAALGKAGVHASEAVMIGDTPYDVAAAKRAHVKVIAVRSGGWGDEPLRAADAIYADIAELLERLEESPIGRPVAGSR
jgi:phosphoglycolate phosphatase-like HAD superfamily hydrolase